MRYMCVCAHVSEHMWACVNMNTFVLKPEDGITCSSFYPLYSVQQDPTLSLGFLPAASPASQLTLGSPLYLLNTGITDSSHVCLALHGIWGIGAVFLGFLRQVLYLLSMSLAYAITYETEFFLINQRLTWTLSYNMWQRYFTD